MVKFINIPRIMWMEKSWTLKQVHLEVFSFFKAIFLDWYEHHNDPIYKGGEKYINMPPFKKLSIDEEE